MIETVIEARERSIGTSTVRRVLPFARRRMVGPFAFLDMIGPEVVDAGRSVDVDAHPHIGLSTLTYLFDGRLVHRDSTGAVQTIEPGDVNWMTAGAGVSHTERSHPSDLDRSVALRGVQIWVALPDGLEDAEPFFSHTTSGDLPRLRSAGADIVVVAGSSWGLESPVPVSSPLVLADLVLDGSGVLGIDATDAERAVLALEGEVSIDGKRLETGQLAVLVPGVDALVAGRGRALLIGGEPVGPRTIWWNFVHSDPARIDQAKADWAAQRFPKVPGDHEPWVPLP